MKKYLGLTLGMVLWAGLLSLQGTPTITEEIAEDTVLATHPDAEICEVDRVSKGNKAFYKVAYVARNMELGQMTIAEDGHIANSK